MTKLDAFMATYAKALQEAVTQHPGEYGYPATLVPAVAARMRNAIVQGNYNHSGRAFKATCKTLGITHTRQAIASYVA